MALKLLDAHRAERAATRAAASRDDGEGRTEVLIEEIKTKLAEMRARQAALDADTSSQG